MGAAKGLWQLQGEGSALQRELKGRMGWAKQIETQLHWGTAAG